MDGDDDPVKRELGGVEDLYDVASWEVRSSLDVLAVRLAGGLRRARTWTLIFVALVLFLAQVAIAGLLILDRPVLGVFALGSALPAFALAGYFWYDDPTRREPLETLAATFVLSILFASFAAVVNTAFQPLFGLVPLFGLPLFFFLVVGPIEETVKWLAIRVHAYKTDTFDTVVDGVVYGAVAGLGFAAIENLIYIVNVSQTVSPAGTAQIGAAFQTATQRAFVGPGHVIYSAFAGYYLGLAKFNPDHRGPIVVKGLVIAATIHALYNSLVSFLPLGGLTFGAFILVYDGFWLGVLYRKLSRYESYYHRARDADSSGTDSPGADSTETDSSGSRASVAESTAAAGEGDSDESDRQSADRSGPTAAADRSGESDGE